MTGTDERCNSRSRSGTPSWENYAISQPVFHPRLPSSHNHDGTSQNLGHQPENSTQPTIGIMGDDPFWVYVPAKHSGIVNQNNDMLQMQNAPGINIQGPLSQEGRHFQWQIPPGPGLPNQPQVPNARHIYRAAREPHSLHPSKLWCTKGSHWVESVDFGEWRTCENCRANSRLQRAEAQNWELA